MNVILGVCGQNLRLLLNHIVSRTSELPIFGAWLMVFFYRFAAVLRL
jgi:hypothetical protein